MSLEGVLAERGNQESTHRDLAHISSTNVSLWMDGWCLRHMRVVRGTQQYSSTPPVLNGRLHPRTHHSLQVYFAT